MPSWALFVLGLVCGVLVMVMSGRGTL